MADSTQKQAADTNNQNFIMKIASRIGGSFVTAMPGLANAAYGASLILFKGPRKEVWDNWADELVTEGLIDQATAETIKPLSQYDFPWGAILSFLTIFQVKMSEVKSTMEIYSLNRQYDLMGQTTPHPAPVDNLIRSMIIDPARATENRVELKKHGFSELQIDNIILSYYRTVDEGTLRTQYLRGIIDETKLYERMRELGYTDQRTGEIVLTWKMLPGPQDLFMMVAKEAFEPDIYTTLGLDEEFPSDQITWLNQQGISEEWARKYWIAHWDQPSIGQGFEMLHRGVIDNATLDMLFRAIEIPSFWRDKLTQIAYNPFTRVDVRRMHDLGVLTDEELIRSYMDQGYDSEKALKMAQFTIRFNTEGDAQLTRSTILESFREDLISYSQAKALLVEQDYTEDLADYYLELESYKRDKKIRDQQIDNLREQFLLNQLTEATARDQLNRMGLRGEKVTILMDSWLLDQYKYSVIPSKSDLDGFLVKGIINEGQYRTYMARHGFSQTAISWYQRDLTEKPVYTPRQPTRTNLTDWYKKNLITLEKFKSEMALLGYENDHITLFINAM